MGKTKAYGLRAVKHRYATAKQITQLSKAFNKILLWYSQEPRRGKGLDSAINYHRSYHVTDLLQIFTRVADSKHRSVWGQGEWERN